MLSWRQGRLLMIDHLSSVWGEMETTHTRTSSLLITIIFPIPPMIYAFQPRQWCSYLNKHNSMKL